MKIDRGFTNNFEESFENIVSINFNSYEEMKSYLGKMVEESKINITNNNSGIYLHKMLNPEDGLYACRLYKNYRSSDINIHHDDMLISMLQAKQKNVRNIDFPIGILSVNNYVVGQIVVYYEQCETLFNYLRYCSDVNVFKSCCLQIISIIEELIHNDIYYCDIHSKNFIVNKYKEIKIVDFELPYIYFNDKSLYNRLLNKLIYMFKYASKCIDILIPYDSSLDEIKSRILIL